VQVVYNRRYAGWSEKKALSVPLREYKKKSTPVLSDEVPYKVETKPVSSKKPTVPLPVEKYEAPKSNTFIYLSIVLVVLVIFAIMST
jgi:hypothetical protein